MPSILGANTLSSGYDVDNSLRFNDGDSAYMHKDQSAGDRNKATFSAWIKRGNLGSNQAFFGIYGAASDAGQIEIRFQGSGDSLHCTGQASNWRRTNRAFTDISAWYHIVVAFDTTQGTAGNRVKVYVNGVQETSFAAAEDPDENEDLAWGLNNAKVVIGSNYNANSPGDYFDGYMAEVVLIDGQQLDPTSFGEFDSDSPQIWKPKDVSGLTFGTNGFYLDFKDSSNLGNDANGGTDLTEVNLAATDQTTDTCTNNFATLNPLNGSGTRTQNDNYSEGNTIVIPANHDNYTTTFSTMGAKKGKWYWEAQSIVEGTASNAYYPRTIGIMTDHNPLTASTLGQDEFSWDVVYNSGNWDASHNGSVVVNDMSTDRTSGNILQFALDLDNGKFYFGIGGTYLNSGDPTTGSTGTGAIHTLSAADLGNFIIPAVTNATTGTYYKFNFGNPAFSISSGNADANGYGNFEYAPPSGYFAWCTKNLAENG